MQFTVVSFVIEHHSKSQEKHPRAFMKQRLGSCYRGKLFLQIHTDPPTLLLPNSCYLIKLCPLLVFCFVFLSGVYCRGLAVVLSLSLLQCTIPPGDLLSTRNGHSSGAE